MKKTLLTLGTLTTILAPIAIVISCGENEKTQPGETTQPGTTQPGETTNPGGTTTPTEPQTLAPLTIAEWKAKYPQYVDRIQGTSIINRAFYDSSLPPGFSIPDGVTSIGEYAFNNKIVNSDFNIPNSVTSIGRGAFNGATFSSDLVIPDTVTSIDNGAFNRATFSSNLSIPNSLTSINQYAFYEIKVIDSNGSISNTNYHWEDSDGDTTMWPKAGGRLVID